MLIHHPDQVEPKSMDIPGASGVTMKLMVGRDDESTPWKRLAVRAPLKPGLMLRSLPTYRPHILLENDLQITFADGIACEIDQGQDRNGVDDLNLFVRQKQPL